MNTCILHHVQAVYIFGGKLLVSLLIKLHGRLYSVWCVSLYLCIVHVLIVDFRRKYRGILVNKVCAWVTTGLVRGHSTCIVPHAWHGMNTCILHHVQAVYIFGGKLLVSLLIKLHGRLYSVWCVSLYLCIVHVLIVDFRRKCRGILVNKVWAWATTGLEVIAHASCHMCDMGWTRVFYVYNHVQAVYLRQEVSCQDHKVLP